MGGFHAGEAKDQVPHPCHTASTIAFAVAKRAILCRARMKRKPVALCGGILCFPLRGPRYLGTLIGAQTGVGIFTQCTGQNVFADMPEEVRDNEPLELIWPVVESRSIEPVWSWKCKIDTGHETSADNCRTRACNNQFKAYPSTPCTSSTTDSRSSATPLPVSGAAGTGHCS